VNGNGNGMMLFVLMHAGENVLCVGADREPRFRVTPPTDIPTCPDGLAVGWVVYKRIGSLTNETRTRHFIGLS
jgi:hypothetical protein